MIKKIPLGKSIILFLIVAIIIPIFFQLAIKGESFSQKANIFFHTQEIIQVMIISFIVYFFIWNQKVINDGKNKKKSISDGKHKGIKYSFYFASVILILPAVFFQIDFYDGLQSGIYEIKGNSINLDKIPLIGAQIPYVETKLNKELIAKKKIEGNGDLLFFGRWSDTNKNNKFDGKVVINGKDISNVFFRLGPDDRKWIQISNLTGDVVLTNDGPDDIFIGREYVYKKDSTLVSMDSGKNWVEDDGTLLMFYKNPLLITPNRFVFYIKPLLVLVSMLLMFYSFFGISLREFFISAFIGGGGFFFINYIKEYWWFFSRSVVSAVHWISSMFFSENFINLESSYCPQIGIRDFVVSICKSSSGVESVGFFTILFLIILVTNWNRLDKMKAMLFFFIGLLGAVIVNILRIFLLLLGGVYISPEFSLGMFHDNIGWILFIVYSAGYWIGVLKFIKKLN